MSAQDRAWEKMQIKAFSKWINLHLKKRGHLVDQEKLGTEFGDGIKLINLYEVIADVTLGKYNNNPKMRVHKIANLDVVLKEINKFVASAGIRLEYSAEQIADGELRSVLGMIWVLIHKFTIADISEEEMSAREGLLLWCQKNTKGYKGVNVQNFNTSWQDGLAFCALINKFRPDLLDYDNLDHSNSLENLKLAFKVAEEKLDIPCLLDPEDMISARPDDKAVMTQVSQYWRKFATSQKNKVAANRVGKLAGRRQANEEMQNNYEKRAKDLIAWVDDKTKTYDTDEFGNSLQAVQNQFKEFQGYKSGEKPPKTAEKLDLESLLANLRSKQKNENSPIYNPPSEIAPAALQQAWDGLGDKERKYESGLRDALLKQKKLEFLLARFRAKVKKLTAWGADREQYLNQTPALDSISAAQAKLKVHEAYEDEYSSIQTQFQSTSDLGQQIIDGKHAASGEVSDSLANLDQMKQNLEGLSASLKEKLNAELERLQNLQNLCLEFAKKAEKFNLWADDVETQLADPINASSVEEVEYLENSVNGIATDIEGHQSAVSDLENLAGQISQAGVQNEFSRFTIDQLTGKYSSATGMLGQRQKDLVAEKEKQIVNAAKLNAYAESAKKFVAFVKSSKDEVEKESPGSLDEQLQVLREKSQTIAQDAHSQFKTLSAEYQAVVEAEVVELAAISLQELQIQLEQLENILKKRLAFIEEAAVSEKTKGISAEELQEFRNAFNHFDKRKIGRLTRLDLKACLQSLGQDLDDNQLNNLMAQIDTDKDGEVEFEEFALYMKSQVAESDKSDDILASFKTLAGDRDFITEAELRSNLSKEQADYLCSVMPKGGNGYDYKAYCQQSFAQH